MTSDPKVTPFKSALISPTGTAMFRSLVGPSPGIQQVRKLIKQVAQRQSTVLIIGESGNGKEIVARTIHYHSGRTERGSFVSVNCASLDREGFQRQFSSRSSAEQPPSLVDKARGGTLFLDVVDELAPEVQALLLRFLEQDNGAEGRDIRLVAACQADLEERVAKGDFRRDLYYHLAVFPIEMPPLRERRDDIPDLLQELSRRLQHNSGVAVQFSQEARSALQRHDWPGNVRELANLVERLSVLKPDELIELHDLPGLYRRAAVMAPAVDVTREPGVREVQADPERPPPGKPEPGKVLPGRREFDDLDEAKLKALLADFERDLIETALLDCMGNVRFAAEHLQMNPAQLDQLMKKHGLNPGGSAA